MVNSCVIVNCSNRQSRGSGISFHRFPKEGQKERRRERWLQAVNRVLLSNKKPWEPNKDDRVCGVHFVSGKPSVDPNNVDYVPTLHLGYSKRKEDSSHSEQRKKRQKVRASKQQATEAREAAAEALLDLSISTAEDHTRDQGVQVHGDRKFEMDVALAKVRHVELELKVVQDQNQELNRRLERAESRLQECKFTYENIKDDINFYTGVDAPVFELIAGNMTVPKSLKISNSDVLLLCLMRIRLGCSNKELGKKFKISINTVGRILDAAFPSLACALKDLIVWPERDVAMANVPEAFKPNFRKVISIIDCFEIFIEKPKNLTTRAQCWSNYKHAYTIKYLISITPAGAISFISPGWGGRVSDKQITLDSHYLDKLTHGHEILADRGFTISEECAARGAKLHIPAFTKGKKQLTGSETVKSRNMSCLRIHVERVIGRLRHFKMLCNKCPLSMVKHLDHAVVITCGLINLKKSIVKDL